MKARPIEIGQMFGYLEVIQDLGTRGKSGRRWVLARCVCGTEKPCRLDSLKPSRPMATVSCGCKKGGSKPVHGNARKGRVSRAYRSWQSMRTRCLNPRSHAYDRYGGRGIKVCERWDSFDSFLEDMGEPPAGHEIDRIDGDGNYEPDNCRWATSTQQNRNRRDNRMPEFRGDVKCLSEWEESLGFPRGLLSQRLKAGWGAERALTEEPRNVG